MFDLAVIEVAIGLTFLFLVLSLIGSAIVEALTEARQWRGRLLYSKLSSILGEDLNKHFYADRRVADLASGPSPLAQLENLRPPKEGLLSRARKKAKRIGDWLGKKLVAGRFCATSLADAKRMAAHMNATRLPSYIPESTFCDVLMDWFQGIGMPTGLHPEAKNPEFFPRHQAELWNQMNIRANGNQHALRLELANWYHQATERMTGEFKRRIRLALYVVAIALVVPLNADAIRMATTLYTDPQLRKETVALAEGFQQIDCQSGIENCVEAKKLAQQNLKRLAGDSSSGLLGWYEWPQGPIAYLSAFLGLLVTVLAIGMGADFWFGILKRLLTVRNASREAAQDVTAAGIRQDRESATPAPRSHATAPSIDVNSTRLAPLVGFDPMHFGERQSHAFWLGQFASMAYCTKLELENSVFLASHGLSVESFEANGTQAFVFSGSHHCIVSFRGTEMVPEDWITDAKFTPKVSPWDSGDEKIAVHSGFHGALDNVWKELESELMKKNTPVWFTGHSLGGALAVLAAYRLVHSAKGPSVTVAGVYTFGQPRAGNREFVASCKPELEQRIFRYVNSSDIVPLIPPESVHDYAHVGQYRYFDAAGRLHLRRTLWERIAEELAPAIVELSEDGNWGAIAKQKLKERVANHAMARYIQCLEQLEEVQDLRATSPD